MQPKGKILVSRGFKRFINESTLRNISEHYYGKKRAEKQVSFYHKNTEILDRVKEYLPTHFLMPYGKLDLRMQVQFGS